MSKNVVHKNPSGLLESYTQFQNEKAFQTEIQLSSDPSPSRLGEMISHGVKIRN